MPQVGTAYTREANVDFSELRGGGGNEAILKKQAAVEHAGVGDLLLIKGTKFPQPGRAQALVHKSPEKRYGPDGRVLRRLVLKVRWARARPWSTRLEHAP